MVLKWIKENFGKICFQTVLIIGFTSLYSFIMIQYFNQFNLFIFIVLVLVSDVLVYQICINIINKWANNTSDKMLLEQYENILDIISNSEDEIFLDKVKKVIEKKNI